MFKENTTLEQELLVSKTEEELQILTEENLIRKALNAQIEHKGINLYHNLIPLNLGKLANGPRACFEVDYGLEGKNHQKRILKIDKLVMPSPKAKLYKEKGCGTLRDFSTLADMGPDANKHHIIPVLDFWKVKDDKGNEYVITAEKRYDLNDKIYPSIESIMDDLKENPLTKHEFKAISADIFDALEFTSEDQKKYNRDFSLRNILTNIRLEKQTEETHNKNYFKKQLSKIKSLFKKNYSNKLEAMVTDHANSILKSEVTPDEIPLIGAKQIADPLLIFGKKFTGTETQEELIKIYDYAEVYAVAKSCLEMLLGEQITAVNITLNDNGEIERTAVVLPTRFTGEFNLVKDGKFDNENYTELLNLVMPHLPSYAKKQIPVLKKALSFDEKERYSSTAEFIKDWKKHEQKNPWRLAKRIIGGTLATVIILSGAQNIYNTLNPKVELDTYIVNTLYNEETKGVDNNYVNLDVSLNSESINSYSSNPKYVFAKKGEEISVNFDLTYLAVDEKYHSNEWFKCRAYIEGEEGDSTLAKPETFAISPVTPGFTVNEVGYYPPNVEYLFNFVKIPKNASDGAIYNLIVELYPMNDTIFCKEWDSKVQDYYNSTQVIFDDHKNTIIRKKIPIMVESSTKIKDEPVGNVLFDEITSEGFTYPRIRFWAHTSTDPYARVDTNINFAVRIPELNYVANFKGSNTQSVNSRDYHLDLPDGPSIEKLTLQTITYKDGKILSQHFNSIARNSVETTSESDSVRTYFSTYDNVIPDSNFIHTIAKYSKDAKDLIK